MKKLIHRYLDNEYYVVKDNVYTCDDFNIYIEQFLEKFILVFDLPKKEIKWYIKSWFKKRYKGFDFNAWWCPPPYQLRLITKRITTATKTINARWTSELSDELSFYHGIDDYQFATEMTSMLLAELNIPVQ